jgi:hypothetical protein
MKLHIHFQILHQGFSLFATEFVSLAFSKAGWVISFVVFVLFFCSEVSLFLTTDFAYFAVLLDYAQNLSIICSLLPFALSFILLLFLLRPSILILSFVNLN